MSDSQPTFLTSHEEIVRLLRWLDISQAEVARRAGVSKTLAQHAIQGKRRNARIFETLVPILCDSGLVDRASLASLMYPARQVREAKTEQRAA